MFANCGRTRACFSEQMMTNCRSQAEAEVEELTSTDDDGDILALRLLADN